jgi:hypothetical protein
MTRWREGGPGVASGNGSAPSVGLRFDGRP